MEALTYFGCIPFFNLLLRKCKYITVVGLIPLNLEAACKVFGLFVINI